MAFIDTVSDSEAAGAVAKLYETDRTTQGYVANYTRTFAHRLAVYEAWQQLRAAITANMDPRRYELATLAAARSLRSSYCTLAHGKILAQRFSTRQACVGSSPTTILPDSMLRDALIVGRPVAEL
jgi:alkylhydroperoxidase family enzyme